MDTATLLILLQQEQGDQKSSTIFHGRMTHLRFNVHIPENLKHHQLTDHRPIMFILWPLKSYDRLPNIEVLRLTQHASRFWTGSVQCFSISPVLICIMTTITRFRFSIPIHLSDPRLCEE